MCSTHTINAMGERFTLALEKLRQQSAPARVAGSHARAAALLPERTLGLPFVAGDAVIDLVTGERGQVLSGTRETVIVATPDEPHR